jgi:hypothetical protein
MGSPAPEAEGQGGPVVIHAWSAPRSLSTSLMYSFAQVRRASVLAPPLRAAGRDSRGQHSDAAAAARGWRRDGSWAAIVIGGAVWDRRDPSLPNARAGFGQLRVISASVEERLGA